MRKPSSHGIIAAQQKAAMDGTQTLRMMRLVKSDKLLIYDNKSLFSMAGQHCTGQQSWDTVILQKHFLMQKPSHMRKKIALMAPLYTMLPKRAMMTSLRCQVKWCQVGR